MIELLQQLPKITPEEIIAFKEVGKYIAYPLSGALVIFMTWFTLKRKEV